MCISVSQLVRNIGIAVFAGRAVFAHLRRLKVITSIYVYIIYVRYIHNLENIWKILQTQLKKGNGSLRKHAIDI